jgi:SAM-dependent methyltransferase
MSPGSAWNPASPRMRPDQFSSDARTHRNSEIMTAPAISPSPPVEGLRAEGLRALVGHLGALGDETRIRLLLVLDQGEMNVGELGRVLQIPLSSVSRHLKTLAEAGWVRFRSEGTARVFRLATATEMSDPAIWTAVRALSGGTPSVQEDRERAEVVLAERHERARAFFRSEAGQWDEVRTRLFGARLDLVPFTGLLAGSDVADLGCGTGGLMQSMAPVAASVVGVDREPEMLAAARTRLASHAHVTLQQGELEALPIAPASVDVAFLVLVLHLVAAPPRVLAEAARILRPGGRLILLDLRPHDRHDYRESMGHLWPGFDLEVLETWLREAGFCRTATHSLPPDPEASGPLLFLTSIVRLGMSR